MMKEEDRPKTAFQTHLGLFQWIRMPFGLATAPATFARAMRALQLDSSAINFFDDIDSFGVLEWTYQGCSTCVKSVKTGRIHGATK